MICLVPKIKNSHTSSAKAVQTETIKTIIADFKNLFVFKYRASKNMSQAAITKTNAIIQIMSKIGIYCKFNKIIYLSSY